MRNPQDPHTCSPAWRSRHTPPHSTGLSPARFECSRQGCWERPTGAANSPHNFTPVPGHLWGAESVAPSCEPRGPMQGGRLGGGEADGQRPVKAHGETGREGGRGSRGSRGASQRALLSGWAAPSPFRRARPGGPPGEGGYTPSRGLAGWAAEQKMGLDGRWLPGWGPHSHQSPGAWTDPGGLTGPRRVI